MSEAEPVVRIAETERRPGAPTPGMDREEAVATDTTWGGFLRSDAGVVSGWHHHGEYESVIYVLTGALRMESGPGGTSVVDAGPGDSCSCRAARSTARAIRQAWISRRSSCDRDEVSRS